MKIRQSILPPGEYYFTIEAAGNQLHTYTHCNTFQYIAIQTRK